LGTQSGRLGTSYFHTAISPSAQKLSNRSCFVVGALFLLVRVRVQVGPLNLIPSNFPPIVPFFAVVFTAPASSFLWRRGRFKICRRCRSRIIRSASVCHVYGASNDVACDCGIGQIRGLLHSSSLYSLAGLGWAERRPAFSDVRRKREGGAKAKPMQLSTYLP